MCRMERSRRDRFKATILVGCTYISYHPCRISGKSARKIHPEECAYLGCWIYTITLSHPLYTITPPIHLSLIHYIPYTLSHPIHYQVSLTHYHTPYTLNTPPKQYHPPYIYTITPPTHYHTFPNPPFSSRIDYVHTILLVRGNTARKNSSLGSVPIVRVILYAGVRYTSSITPDRCCCVRWHTISRPFFNTC